MHASRVFACWALHFGTLVGTADCHTQGPVAPVSRATQPHSNVVLLPENHILCSAQGHFVSSFFIKFGMLWDSGMRFLRLYDFSRSRVWGWEMVSGTDRALAKLHLAGGRNGQKNPKQFDQSLFCILGNWIKFLFRWCCSLKSRGIIQWAGIQKIHKTNNLQRFYSTDYALPLIFK